jgi:hypothetical protein
MRLTVLLEEVTFMLGEVIEGAILDPLRHGVESFPSRDRVCPHNGAEWDD